MSTQYKWVLIFARVCARVYVRMLGVLAPYSFTKRYYGWQNCGDACQGCLTTVSMARLAV